MKCSVGISNFLEEISSLTHSIVFLYFFALITEDGFLISPCYSFELSIQLGVSFPFTLPFASLLFSAICKASSDNHFAFLHFFFLGMVLITASCTMSWTSVHHSSGTLSDLIPESFHSSLCLSHHKGFPWPLSLKCQPSPSTNYSITVSLSLFWPPLIIH